MESREACLDIRSGKHTNYEINRLVDYISGQLSNQSLIFLQKICVKNAAALEKLITKCSQLKIKLKASDLNRVIDSLHNQMNLPQNILEAIQYYLLDKRMHGITNMFNATNNQLEADLSAFSMLKSTLHVLDNLNLLTQSNQEEQFLKSIITMLVDFQNKDHHFVKSCNPRKSASDDASKWLRTLLNVSEKSDLTKFIHLIADRLHLSETVMHGDIRNMDLTELFFLLEEIAHQADIQVVHESNKKLMLDINAIILTTHVCKKTPTAFFDVVSLQQSNENDSVLSLVKKYYSKSLIIESFFQHSSFKPYFRKHSHDDKANHHAFLISLVTHLQSLSFSSSENVEPNTNIFSQFISTCRTNFQKLGKKAFIQWLLEASSEPSIDNILQEVLFNAIEREAEQHNNRLGSLVFIANKLVAMGFSPRSASVATSGFFQPLITTHVPKTDLENFKSLKIFLETLKPNHKKQLTQEIILSVIVNPRKLSTRNEATKSHRRTVDNHYPIPTLNSIKVSAYSLRHPTLKDRPPKTSTVSQTRRASSLNNEITTFTGAFFSTTPKRLARTNNTPTHNSFNNFVRLK